MLTAQSGDAGGMTWAAAAAGPSQANQAALEAETDEDTYAAPDMIKYSPGVAKVWVEWETIGAHSIGGSYNMTSVTDGGDVGATDHLWNVDFSSGVYVIAAMAAADKVIMTSGAIDAGGVTTTIRDLAGTKADMVDNMLVAFGDQ